MSAIPTSRKAICVARTFDSTKSERLAKARKTPKQSVASGYRPHSNTGAQRRRVDSGPVGRYEPEGHHDDGDDVQQHHPVEIGRAAWLNDVVEPPGEKRTKRRHAGTRP